MRLYYFNKMYTCSNHRKLAHEQDSIRVTQVLETEVNKCISVSYLLLFST